MSRTNILRSWINTLAITAAAAVGIVVMSSHSNSAPSATTTTAGTAATSAAPAASSKLPSTLTALSSPFRGGDDGAIAGDN